MSRILTIIGPRRTGLHAIANWLIGLHRGRVRLVNDPATAFPPTPAELARYTIDYEVTSQFIIPHLSLGLLQEKARQLNWSTAVNLPWPWHGLARRLLLWFWEPRLRRAYCSLPSVGRTDMAEPDPHIILFENLAPAEAAQALPIWLSTYRREQGLPAVKREHIFIVLRSPWNCLASTLKRPQPHPPRPTPPEQVGALWVKYASEITRETCYFDEVQWDLHPLIFEELIEHAAQRSAIATELGRPPSDLGISEIADFGGGSSFTGQNTQPGSLQELTSRWRHYQNHPLMKELLTSTEVLRLAEALKMAIPTPLQS